MRIPDFLDKKPAVFTLPACWSIENQKSGLFVISVAFFLLRPKLAAARVSFTRLFLVSVIHSALRIALAAAVLFALRTLLRAPFVARRTGLARLISLSLIIRHNYKKPP